MKQDENKKEETYSFNINFVNKKLSPFSAADSISHNYVSNGQNPWAKKQSYLHGSTISISVIVIQTTKHIWCL